MRIRFVLAAVGAFVLAACGDDGTPDRRGYTKAPLEDPGYTIESEEASPMAEMGEPKLPRPEEVEVETDTAAAGS